MRAKRMLTIQNNLFPVDFSSSCVAMAPHVKRAAVIFGASATLVHVLDLYTHNESNSTCSSSLTRDWGRVADNLGLVHSLKGFKTVDYFRPGMG